MGFSGSPFPLSDFIHHQLLKTPNRSTDETVAECLTTALSVASRNPPLHAELLERMLHEIAAMDGVIRKKLTDAFPKDDAETVLRLARIYRYTVVGNADRIALALHKDQEIRELLPIMLRLSSVPFDMDDDARGLNGIAAQMFDAWEVLAVSTGRVRFKLVDGSYKSDPCLAAALKDPGEIGEIIEQQNGLFDQLIRTLLSGCLIPTALLDCRIEDHDYHQYVIFGQYFNN